jgi:hypothetical protein
MGSNPIGGLHATSGRKEGQGEVKRGKARRRRQRNKTQSLAARLAPLLPACCHSSPARFPVAKSLPPLGPRAGFGTPRPTATGRLRPSGPQYRPPSRQMRRLVRLLAKRPCRPLFASMVRQHETCTSRANCLLLQARRATSGRKPPWPNGQGVGPLIRRLRVRVPQGVLHSVRLCRNPCCVALDLNGQGIRDGRLFPWRELLDRAANIRTFLPIGRFLILYFALCSSVCSSLSLPFTARPPRRTTEKRGRLGWTQGARIAPPKYVFCPDGRFHPRGEGRRSGRAQAATKAPGHMCNRSHLAVWRKQAWVAATARSAP